MFDEILDYASIRDSETQTLPDWMSRLLTDTFSHKYFWSGS